MLETPTPSIPTIELSSTPDTQSENTPTSHPSIDSDVLINSISDVLSEPRILTVEEFYPDKDYYWDYAGSSSRIIPNSPEVLASGDLDSILNGVLEISGEPASDARYKKQQFVEGEGIILKFWFDYGSWFDIFYYVGNGGGFGSRHFGIGGNLPTASSLYTWVKGSDLSPLKGTFYPKPQSWYYLMLAIGPDGEFFTRIWDPNNSDNYITYLENLDRGWQDSLWEIRIICQWGKVLIDDFMKISFNEVLIN